LLRHPPRISQGAAQDQLDLRVDAAELIRRPPGQRIVHRRVHAQQDRLALSSHE
jgi:hypothetical protein